MSNIQSPFGGLRAFPLVKIRLKPLPFAFFLIFFVIYCFSGFLTVVTNYHYRMGLVSLFVFPLVFRYGIRTSNLFLMYLLLAIEVFASGLLNMSTPYQIMLFMRILFFSFAMYYLAEQYVTFATQKKILKLSMKIGLIQLPVILLQWSLYPSLPESWKRAALVDFGFGTFNYMTDYAMSFFIITLLIFLLFDNRSKIWFQHRWLLAIWFSLTILVANAQIMKLALIFVWTIYLLTHLRLKNVIYFSIAALVLTSSINTLMKFNILTEDATTFVKRFRLKNTQFATQEYLSGEYSRYGALIYLAKNATLFGEGPSAYSDPITRTRKRGNTGHFFTFLSEVGIVGWLFSVMIFFLVAHPVRKGRVRFRWSSLMIFIIINMLSFTSEVMNDVSVMFAYSIMARVFYYSPGDLSPNVCYRFTIEHM